MGSDVTIFAVDDNEAHRYFVCRALDEAGFRAVPFANGSEVLAKAHERPDLILLDVHLPDVNGFEVCRQLKADPQTSDIPVVLFSSIAQDGSAVNDAKQLGAASFLFFPMSSEQLVSVVRGSISRSKKESGSHQRL